jgi:hypothetical protein
MTDIVNRLREVAEIETGLLYSRRQMLKDAANEITALRSERDSLKALCDEMAKALEDEKERCAVFLAHREELIGLLRSFRGDVFEEVASFAENYGDTYSVGRGIAQSIRALAKAKEAE